MIIFGTKAKLLRTDKVEQEICAHCGAQHSIYVSIFQRYFHIFWIPFFPIGKAKVSQCGHCRQTLQAHEMPLSLETTSKLIAAQASTPVWTFAGLALLGIFTTWGIISDQQKDKETLTFVTTPQYGDVYEVKLGDKAYTLFRVAEVQADSILFYPHQYETTKSTGLIDLRIDSDKKNQYDARRIALAKLSLKNMIDEGKILGVYREN
ncbi:hypothetical protein P1X15_22970 [Runella sp. MFBS21]|uniref:hypothetical protein n=1 Tax=Runella sp. MFBS21 TaxID=3034018 RepID=UPI0023F680EC|nr:hypothetical protein [Runella sp. MFBS21]MDF7820504.1 hypothetical protein [Runella sp. MFBS21]